MEQELQNRIQDLEQRIAQLESGQSFQDVRNVAEINRDKFVVNGGKDTSSTTASGYLVTRVNGIEYKVLIV